MESNDGDHSSMATILKLFGSWPDHRLEKASETVDGLIIGIAGCTNSGKTTLANTIAQLLNNDGKRTAIISQDNYFYRQHTIERISSTTDPNITFHNYDTKHSVNAEKIVDRILRDAATSDFVIVEGHLLLEMETVWPLIKRTVFITIDRETCKERRTNRIYNPPDLPGYFDEVVWPSYKRNLNHAFALARNLCPVVFIDGTIHKFANVCSVQKLFVHLSRNLLIIQNSALDLNKAVSFVNAPIDGGISTFIGTTRDNYRIKRVVRLEFEAYDEMVYKELHQLCSQVRQHYPSLDRIAVLHKLGTVEVAEASLIIATSAPHRHDAIKGMELAIDLLKSKVPVWKKEVYADGSSIWKTNCECHYKQHKN